MLGLVAAHARDECLDLRLQVRVERERLLQVGQGLGEAARGQVPAAAKQVGVGVFGRAAHELVEVGRGAGAVLLKGCRR